MFLHPVGCYRPTASLARIHADLKPTIDGRDRAAAAAHPFGNIPKRHVR